MTCAEVRELMKRQVRDTTAVTMARATAHIVECEDCQIHLSHECDKNGGATAEQRQHAEAVTDWVLEDDKARSIIENSFPKGWR